MHQPKTLIFSVLYLKCLIQVDRGYSHGKKKGNAFKIALGLGLRDFDIYELFNSLDIFLYLYRETGKGFSSSNDMI